MRNKIMNLLLLFLLWAPRLFVLCCLLLVVVGRVEAQCTGQYANDPTYPVLLPKDFAAQGSGNEAVTLTVSASDGSQTSGRMTVGGAGAGTVLALKTQMWNTSSASVYYSQDNGNWTFWFPLNAGQTNYVTMGAGWIGHIFNVKLVGNITSTQDVIHVTVTNQTPGIYFADDLETNFYQQVITTFGGSSMLTSCQECQAGTTQHCINATHTPYTTISLTNSTSGESQFIQDVQSGNMAHSNESLTGSASLAISVRPGDSGTISIDDKIICSMDGVIFEQTLPKPKTSPSGGSWNPSVTGELAFTKVALKVPTHCTPLVDSNGNVIGLHCDVAYYCTARSSPPDYQPTGLDTYHYTNPALVPPFWMSMAPGTALVFGKNQPGEIAVWYFPFSTLHGVLTNVGGMDPLLLDILSPAWASDNSAQDCTKWISGISPWYMPKW